MVKADKDYAVKPVYLKAIGEKFDYTLPNTLTLYNQKIGEVTALVSVFAKKAGLKVPDII